MGPLRLFLGKLILLEMLTIFEVLLPTIFEEILTDNATAITWWTSIETPLLFGMHNFSLHVNIRCVQYHISIRVVHLVCYRAIKQLDRFAQQSRRQSGYHEWHVNGFVFHFTIHHWSWIHSGTTVDLFVTSHSSNTKCQRFCS